MRKLIRKILKEDEWDFVKYTEAKLVKGIFLCNNSKKFASGNTVVTKVDDFRPNMVYTTDLVTGNHYVNQLDRVMEWLKSGEMTICDPLNESNDMDWIENTNPVPLGEWDKPREGEHLMCLPGFQNKPRSGLGVRTDLSTDGPTSWGGTTLPYGGAGYVEGRVITVERVSGSPSIGYIIWPADGPNPGYSTDGIYAFALARI